jgi:hypothetical protein
MDFNHGAVEPLSNGCVAPLGYHRPTAGTQRLGLRSDRVGDTGFEQFLLRVTGMRGYRALSYRLVPRSREV